MKLYDYTRRKYRTVTVDMDAYIPPSYAVAEDSLDDQLLKERYSKLNNFSKTPLSIRCNGLIYGGADRSI